MNGRKRLATGGRRAPRSRKSVARSIPSPSSDSARSWLQSRPADWRLAPAAILAWVVAFMGVTNPALCGPLIWTAAVLTASAALLLVATARWRTRPSSAPGQSARAAMKRMPVRSRRHVDEALRLATVSLGIAMLVAACVTGWQAGRLPAPLREAIGGSNATHEAELVVTGLVSDTVMSGRASGAHRSEPPGDTALGPRFHAVLIRLNGSELSTPVLVRGTIAGDEAPAPGTRIAARGRLREAPPGQRIAATLVPRGDARVTGLPPGPQSALADFRNGLLERSSALPGAGGELLAGLAVGDDRRVSDPL